MTATPESDQRERHPFDDLISQLATAEAGSLELSNQVAASAGWEFKDGWCRYPGETHFVSVHAPDFSRSLDAALTLVPEGWVYEVADYGSDSAGPRAALYSSTEEAEIGEYDLAVGAYAATPALALCIAALKACRARKAQGAG